MYLFIHTNSTVPYEFIACLAFRVQPSERERASLRPCLQTEAAGRGHLRAQLGLRACTHVPAHTCVPARAHMHTRPCTHACVHMPAHTCACACLHTHVPAHTPVHTCLHTHLYTRACTHTALQALSWPLKGPPFGSSRHNCA